MFAPRGNGGLPIARKLEFLIAPPDDGKKVFSVLRGNGVSARLLGKLKRTDGGITRNGAHARTIDRVQTGDLLCVSLPEDCTAIEATPLELDIVFEDADLLLINKPAGLAMHPTHNHQGDTLANAVSAYFAQAGKQAAFRAVGRLDKGTSGLVLCAKHAFAAAKLSKPNQVQKIYFALAHGDCPDCGTYTNAIYRPFANRTLRACRLEDEPGQQGDESAVTHWDTIARGDGWSFLRVWLETGRTHQIRVHFAAHGHPLLGDDYYGAPPRAEGCHHLHCGVMSFLHPVTGDPMEFRAALPAHMEWIIDPEKS
ncbi:MAG: RluA family pseudouridine synthase [Oscillospiraceae bacterium]|nr:RluA family pseudouridine synthase [Oscillospiraceae bacterium]